MLQSGLPMVEDDMQHTPCILIVDDNPNDRMRYKDLLSKASYNCNIYEAENMSDAHMVINTHQLDCILLDNFMPNMNGIEFLKSGDSAKLDAAIIMVTSIDNRQTAVESLKYGADDYLVKNEITEDNFIRAIQSALKKNELKRQIHDYQKELERSNEELSEFAHTVAHDLKIPFHKIIKFCEKMVQSDNGLTSAEISKHVEYMGTSSRHIKSLIDNLLIYASTMKHSEDRELLCLKGVLNEILINIDSWLYENNATVKSTVLPKLNVYPVRIQQLFLNIITNGVKYKHPDRDPHLNITHAVEGGFLAIAFEDNGIGISNCKIEDIFKPFSRLNVANDVRGTGLGLSICQKAIVKHGGKIDVSSKENIGSTFKVYLPID